MVGFFFFSPCIFKYLDPRGLIQTTYMQLDLTPLPEHSVIIFRLSELARMLFVKFCVPLVLLPLQTVTKPSVLCPIAECGEGIHTQRRYGLPLLSLEINGCISSRF